MPDEDPSGDSVILGYYEYLQLKDRARVLTAAEKAAREEQLKREKEEKMVGSITHSSIENKRLKTVMHSMLQC